MSDHKENILDKFPKILRFKWNHYFFEFIVLFLAVFLGFLSDNYRESIAERKTEVKQVSSIIEDLKVDVATIKKNIEVIDIAILYTDSLLLLIEKIPSMDSLDDSFNVLNGRGSPYLRFKSVDRTASQLKNGGQMNLIKDVNLSNEILNYWNLGELTMDTQVRYNVYRLKSREIYFATFRTYQFDLMDGKLSPRKKIPIIQSELSRLGEWANYISSCGVILRSHKKNLKVQSDAATSLIKNINETYSF